MGGQGSGSMIIQGIRKRVSIIPHPFLKREGGHRHLKLVSCTDRNSKLPKIAELRLRQERTNTLSYLHILLSYVYVVAIGEHALVKYVVSLKLWSSCCNTFIDILNLSGPILYKGIVDGFQNRFKHFP